MSYQQVQEYLKKDRQWPRWLRIAHAQYQLRLAKTETERVFWREVKKANSHFADGKVSK